MSSLAGRGSQHGLHGCELTQAALHFTGCGGFT